MQSSEQTHDEPRPQSSWKAVSCSLSPAIDLFAPHCKRNVCLPTTAFSVMKWKIQRSEKWVGFFLKKKNFLLHLCVYRWGWVQACRSMHVEFLGAELRLSGLVTSILTGCAISPAFVFFFFRVQLLSADRSRADLALTLQEGKGTVRNQRSGLLLLSLCSPVSYHYYL